MRRSLMEHSFSRIPEINMPRSTFNRSHSHDFTMDADYLIPCLIDEILPGDTCNLEMTHLVRLATPYFPILTQMYFDSFFFFVPMRLLWSNFKKFMGEQVDPGDSIAYTIPQTTLDTDATAAHGSLGDYLGLPLIDYNTSNYTCNALIERAYWRIYNEWFRDENLKDSSDKGLETGDGPDGDTVTWNVPVKRGKRHDYFTSALPWLQKGDTVELPLGTEAPIEYYDHADVSNVGMYVRLASDDSLEGSEDLRVDASGKFVNWAGGAEDWDFVDPNGKLYADLSSASAASINEIRQAFQLQRFLEKDARSGTRYVEIVQSHFGIRNAGGDARFQRPEYLGGASNPINVTPIPVTADSGSFEAGELSAIGTGYGKSGFIKSFTEHGYLIGIVNVRADIAYQEGLSRMWTRSTRYDIFWPVLQNIGEQAILDREIYIDDATITAGTDTDVFGYIGRYDEYRYFPSRVSGLFRSNAGSSLDVWHLFEEFGSTPSLDSTFIDSNAMEGIDRAIQAPSEPQFIVSCYFDYKHTRPMGVMAIPGFVDHF